MIIELTISARTVRVGLPFLERVRRVANRSPQVEIWDWSNHLDDPDELAAMNAEVVSMTGHLRGNLTDDDAIPELLATAEESLRMAEKLYCLRSSLYGTGLNGRGLSVRPAEIVTDAMWARAIVTLQRVATLGGRESRVFTLEGFSLTVDHLGTPLTRAEDTLALVSTADSPGLHMNLDLYHAQIGEGNLIELCRRVLPWVGEIQVAGVSGRCESGTGEINYPAVATTLREMGYDGTATLKAFVRNDPGSIIDAFIRAFTLETE